MAPALFILPTELFLEVAEYLSSADLASLSATCRPIHTIADPVLYKRAATQHPYLLPWACETQQVGIVQKLLAAGASPNAPYQLSRSRLSLLKYSSEADYEYYSDDELRYMEPETPRDLLEDVYRPYLHFPHLREHNTGPNPDYSPEQLATYSPAPCYWFPIHAAAKAGCDKIINLLVDYGSCLDPPSVDFCWCPRYAEKHNEIGDGPYRWTPLHTALCSRKGGTAKLLISLGASLSIDFSNVPTVVHSAAAHGCLSILRHLSDTGRTFDVNEKDQHGLTPLVHARGRPLDHRTNPWLVAQGADVRTVLGDDGWTILHSALLKERYIDAMNFIDSGADIHAIIRDESANYWHEDKVWEESFDDWRPLHFLCRRNGPYGIEDIHQSSEEERTRVVEKLIELGADVETRDNHKSAPLILASMSHFLPIIKLLIAAGAKICGKDYAGYFPLLAVVDFLEDEYDEFSVAPIVSGSGSDDLLLRTAIYLLDHGADPNQESKKLQRTPLTFLCSAWCYRDSDKLFRAKLVRLLLERGADPNLSDGSNSTPLKEAIKNGSVDVISDLIQYGAQGYSEYAEKYGQELSRQRLL
ncbi:ankyrin repeat-containing domain protein [Hypoxylon sp. FL1150]|nr:ankyrin repeat-containing domain protein [Hypoxylon sp. FL1150]